MKFFARLVLFIAIVLSGIYCLPDGPRKLEYIMFRLFPGLKIEVPAVEKPLVEQDVESVEEESFPDVDDDKSQTFSRPSAPGNIASKLHANRAAVRKVIGDNYLDAVLSAGKLERWNPRSFPLNVYIQAGAEVPAEYIQEVRNAFSTWENSTKGFVKFVYTNNPHSAHYKCVFPSNLKNRNCDDSGMGTAAYQYFTYDSSGNIKNSVVEFSVYMCDGKTKWPAEIFYSTALHEIGHGLGLRGHSTNPEDLMYPISSGKRERDTISEADMSTLRAIYSIIPDITNIPFTDADKKGLITTADLWGEENQRADFTIQKIKDNIKLTPDNPALYAELARAYRDKKDYNSAIPAYSQALKKVDNPETAVALLLDVSDLYMEIGKLDSAEKCINKAASYGNNKYLASFYNILAVKYAEQKEYNKASQIFDKALSCANDEKTRQIIYQNYRWLAWIQKDKVMFDKYNNLLKK